MNLEARHLEELADSLVSSHDKLMEDLVQMRKRHQLSQDAVAERMGVSQPTVAAFERYDANPTLSTIRRYALAVGASIEHVVKDSCCSATGDQFDAVIAGGVSSQWVFVQTPVEWDWTAGKAGALAVKY